MQRTTTVVFIGTAWTLETAVLTGGKVAGYATNARSATTYGLNDPAYTAPFHGNVPKSVRHRLEQVMRRAGWVQDHFATLRPEYLRELAARGDGRRLPVDYADPSLARLYFPGDVNHPMYVEHYRIGRDAYGLWLALPRGVRCAMRNAGETLAVYPHDLVDRG